MIMVWRVVPNMYYTCTLCLRGYACIGRWLYIFNFNDDLYFEFTKYLLHVKILNKILNCIEYTFYDPDHLPIHKIINYFDLNSWQPTLWLILPITYYSLPPIITLDIWAFIILTTKQYGSKPHIFMKFFYVPSYLSYFITFDIIRDVSSWPNNSTNLMITILFF